MSKLTINQIISSSPVARTAAALTAAELELVAGGGFWTGVAKVIGGVAAVATAVAVVLTAPVSVPIVATAAIAVLAGAKTAVEGGVEAYDDRHTWDDGSPTRGGGGGGGNGAYG
jgi:hypothetical protein